MREAAGSRSQETEACFERGCMTPKGLLISSNISLRLSNHLGHICSRRSGAA